MKIVTLDRPEDAALALGLLAKCWLLVPDLRMLKLRCIDCNNK